MERKKVNSSQIRSVGYEPGLADPGSGNERRDDLAVHSRPVRGVPSPHGGAHYRQLLPRQHRRGLQPQTHQVSVRPRWLVNTRAHRARGGDRGRTGTGPASIPARMRAYRARARRRCPDRPLLARSSLQPRRAAARSPRPPAAPLSGPVKWSRTCARSWSCSTPIPSSVSISSWPCSSSHACCTCCAACPVWLDERQTIGSSRAVHQRRVSEAHEYTLRAVLKEPSAALVVSIVAGDEFGDQRIADALALDRPVAAAVEREPPVD